MDRVQLETEIVDFSTRLGSTRHLCAVEDLDRGLDLIEEVDGYLKKSYAGGSNASPRTNIVVLGASGAGKSTVISFLYGSGRMIVHHETPYSRVLIAENPLVGVAIQSGSTSSTLLPVCCHVDGADGVAVWDMPGSQDTRGPFVELLVHKIYEWMLANGKTLRFVIVSPPPTERPQRAALEKMINSSIVSQENAAIVYTKCSREFHPRSTAGLEISDEKLNIRSFAMREPRFENPDGHDYSEEHSGLKSDVLETLEQLHSSATTFSGSLPPAAQLLQNEFREFSIASAGDEVSKWFMKAFHGDNYRGTVADMEDILRMLNSAGRCSFHDVLSVLPYLARTAQDRILLDDGVRQAKRRLDILFRVNVYRHLSGWLSAPCMSALETVKQDCAVLLSQMSSYRDCVELANEPNARGNQTKVLVIGAFQLKLSNEKENILNFVENRQRQVKTNDDIPVVILVGFESLEIDVSLRVWANIALISPVVTVTTAQTLDLSAVGQAPSVGPENHVAGASGSLGLPGLPGGNLVVVCTTLEDDKHLLYDTSSWGQQGGNAQNGGDGVNGADSTYTVKNFEDELKRWIKTCALPTKDDAFGADLPGEIHAVEGSYKTEVPPSSGFWYGTTGKREGEFERASMGGTEGIPPGCGGKGGAGGRGGRIRVVESNDVVWDKESCCGEKGNDGLPGNPSCNSRKSPSFHAHVQQWYYTGRIFWGYAEKPKIEVAEGSQPVGGILVALHASESGLAASPNNSLDVSSVKRTVDFLRGRLEDEFPQCDFADIKINLDFADASEEEVQAA